MPTVLTQRALPATISALTTRVRRLVGDTNTVVGAQRWSNADIYAALDAQLSLMHNELTAHDGSAHMQQINFLYQGGATTTALPVNYSGNSILKVEEDLPDTNQPLWIDWVQPVELDRFSDRKCWTIIGNAIALRPVPAAEKSLIITFVGNFIPISNTQAPTLEQHTMSANHEELIALGAAINLQEIDENPKPARLLRYNMLWDQFKQSAARYRGRIYVQPTRIILG